MTIERALTGLTKSTTSAVYIEDCFSCYLYTGTGASQTITNGIDLSTKGGLVWLKGRSGATDHALYDTARGATYDLGSNLTAAQTTQSTGLTAFGTTGFTIGALAKLNTSAATYTSWTFRKQAKFFDIVTYTGNGGYKTVNHNLGSTPGMIIIKRTDAIGAWAVYHRSIGAGYTLYLNNTNASASSNNFQSATSTQFAVYEDGVDTTTNLNGATYVAYLFAHDAGGFGTAGTDSVVACGSYTGTGAVGNAITLGWEPQYILIKRASEIGPWLMFDNMRGMSYSGTSYLFPNTSGAEVLGLASIVPTSTGFTYIRSDNDYNATGATYIYLAIRRGPMKTPTDATKVFAPVARTGTSSDTVITSGFPADLCIVKARSNADLSSLFMDRLRDNRFLQSGATDEEIDNTFVFPSNMWDKQTAVDISSGINATNSSSHTYANWLFRRAPGFFDVVCYTGTGSARTVSHNLGVAPELIIVKGRSSATDWPVYHIGLNSGTSPSQYYLRLNGNSSESNAVANWNNTAPTSSVFSIAGNNVANSVTYVAYLFATCPGVSKVGSYTGSGTTKQIDCGFTNGARFVLIRRAQASDTSGWYIWDTARGIVSGNDPYILLNTTAAEVTNTDYIDPYSAGFEISSTAPAAINASGGTFIYLAIA